MQSETYRPLVEALLGYGVPPATAEMFAMGLSRRSYHAKDTVFVEGDDHPHAAFVLSGYMRLYVTDNDGEISTRYLAGPDSFIGCIMSILYDSPAHYTGECITDCDLLLVNKNTILEAKQRVQTRAVLQDIILHHLVDMMQEKALMLPLKATDRYLFFRERYPTLMDRIPSGVLANYIGVRPQSLSRIKQMLR